jgi:hypothetical protein
MLAEHPATAGVDANISNLEPAANINADARTFIVRQKPYCVCTSSTRLIWKSPKFSCGSSFSGLVWWVNGAVQCAVEQVR